MEQKIKEKREKWRKKLEDAYEIENFSLLTFRSIITEALLDCDELLEYKHNHCCDKKVRGEYANSR